MDFLRRHLFVIISALVAIAGIALGVTGLRAMPAVQKEMEVAQGVYSQLDTLRPVNLRAIKAQEDRIAEVQADYRAVLDRAKRLYRTPLLVPDALPAGDFEKMREFRTKYRQRMKDLLTEMHAGMPASASDIQLMEDTIDQEKQEHELYTAGTDEEEDTGGSPKTPAGVLTKAGAIEDAAARAHIAAARQIYCYAQPFVDNPNPNYVAAEDFNPDFYLQDIDVPPEPFMVFWAQLGLWVHEDIFRALRTVNEQAADQLRQAEQAPWVANLPVKDIISIRISRSFIMADADPALGYPAGGRDAALPPDSPAMVFTQTATEPGSYYVLQYSVKLVMDQRDLPTLIKELTANTFHVVQRVVYRVEPFNRTMHGRIYGAEPVVNVVIDGEVVLLDEVIRPLMPPSVLEEYSLEPWDVPQEGQEGD